VKADDRHYSLVAELLANGDVIPFLGAGANLCDRPASASFAPGRFAPSGGELANTLAKSSRYPDRQDLDLLLDVSDNIAPGLAFPYPMTTICFLGPSSLSFRQQGAFGVSFRPP